MNIERETLNYKKTVKDIVSFAKKYMNDLPDDISSMSIKEFYDFVKNIPYKDSGVDQITGKPIEAIHRPMYTLKGIGIACDCGDKTVLCGAYANKNKIDWIPAVSGVKYPQHVFPIFLVDGNSLIFDATYANNVLGTLYPENPGFLEVFF